MSEEGNDSESPVATANLSTARISFKLDAELENIQSVQRTVSEEFELTLKNQLGDDNFGYQSPPDWINPDFSAPQGNRLNIWLTPFHGAVLQDAANQLAVLSSMYVTRAGHLEPRLELYRTIDERFGGDVSKKLENYRINTILTDIHLVQSIIGKLYAILDTINQEMLVAGTFSSLHRLLFDISKTQDDNETLIREVHKSEKFLSYLRTHLVEEKRKTGALLEEFDGGIYKMKAAVEDVREKLSIKQSFQTRWQNARVEQNNMVLSNKENVYRSVIERCKKDMETDNRIHEEVTLFTNQLKEDYAEEIQQWMDRYDRELEERDNDIIRMKVKTEKLREDYQQLEEDYNKRTSEIESYLEHKRIKLEEENRKNLEIWAATKIEAWWRGTMVRRKLGPYRRKGKKGKKDKGKSKGGKKKK